MQHSIISRCPPESSIKPLKLLTLLLHNLLLVILFFYIKQSIIQSIIVINSTRLYTHEQEQTQTPPQGNQG